MHCGWYRTQFNSIHSALFLTTGSALLGFVILFLALNKPSLPFVCFSSTPAVCIGTILPPISWIRFTSAIRPGDTPSQNVQRLYNFQNYKIGKYVKKWEKTCKARFADNSTVDITWRQYTFIRRPSVVHPIEPILTLNGRKSSPSPFCKRKHKCSCEIVRNLWETNWRYEKPTHCRVFHKQPREARVNCNFYANPYMCSYSLLTPLMLSPS